MAKGNLDLDRALDETIKLNSSKGRGGKKLPPPVHSKRPVDRASHHSAAGGRQQTVHSSAASNYPRHPHHTTIHSRAPTRGGHVNQRIGSKPVHQRVGGGSDTLINSRLGRGINKPHRGPGVVSSRAVSAGVRNGDLIINRSSRGSSERLDPSKIIITKPVINRTASVKKTDKGAESLVIQSKIKKPPHVSTPDTKSKPKQHTTHPSRQHRTRSSPSSSSAPSQSQQRVATTTATATPIPEPEKKIVLVCNLDPRATAEDVGEACSMFGPILSCDMLLDPMGRPLNEAEIEFMHADSAKECVAKLDNNLADGRLLRAKLQDAPTQAVKPRYSSRSVVASARLQPGAFDNQSPMLQQQPQQQPIQHHPYQQQQHYPPVYSSQQQPYYPQQQPPPHYSQNQHYRRY
ncbi:hypothetical protein V8B55DRAFT_1538632 [Mucor lusitanicus]|uniref:RRM domain-containing protein n=2 Tax=Mucor circinelloides f. lusitanicus TaxID=29924 RepID=A0A168N6I0_MUCCL|nr:hypothetical protein FB192DRAFT_1386856 [Mucor lusitanicus]OAD05858.1 hypothetical protein MUCCIDRAFT_106418 [Mucor lusitanicus CBS 277.49]